MASEEKASQDAWTPEERTPLLPSSRPYHSETANWAPSALIIIILVILGTKFMTCTPKEQQLHQHPVPRGYNAMLLTSMRPQHEWNCDDLVVGAWVESCFVISYSDSAFPDQQGVLSYPIIITRKDGGGFHLYGYSIQEPFFGGADYWELGEGSPSRVDRPSSNTHCIAHFRSKLRVGAADWADDDGEYYWNRISDDQIVTGDGKSVACFFHRLHGNECLEVRVTAMAQFSAVNVTLQHPSDAELCG